MTEKQKKRNKDVEIRHKKKNLAWSRGMPMIVVPAAMRDALGLRPENKTEVEISLLEDGSGMLVHVLK